MKTYDRWNRNRKIMKETPEIWLFKSQKFGYIQIPKVASSSTRERLAKFYFETKNIDQPEKFDKEIIRSVEKITAFHANHKKLYDLTKNNFIFSFVRNPYSRIYSAYKSKVILPLESHKKNIFFNHGISLGMDFETFVDIVCAIPDHKIDRHLRSQSWFLTFEGKLITNHIGRLESFEEDWENLLKPFGLSNPGHNKNSTKKIGNPDITEVFSVEIRQKIQERYKSDFLLFNYSEHLKP